MSLESEEAYGLRQHDRQTTLYELHGSAIFGYLRLHARSLEDTEDLLLEVFLAALEHDNLASMAPDKQLAWLRRVAHNKLVNVHRQLARHPQVALDPLIDICRKPSWI